MVHKMKYRPLQSTFIILNYPLAHLTTGIRVNTEDTKRAYIIVLNEQSLHWESVIQLEATLDEAEGHNNCLC